jgi:putative acetyltransferase
VAADLIFIRRFCALPVKERPYESADLPSVIEIYTTSIRSLAASYYSPDQIAAWAPVPADAARWRERLSHLHTIVAESDGVVAGFASYTNDGYLDFLFTHPAFARRGVATGLYQRVESALRAVSAPRVWTRASLAARPFFDRHGFQLDAEECVECRGAYLRRFAMHKELCNERNA